MQSFLDLFEHIDLSKQDMAELPLDFYNPQVYTTRPFDTFIFTDGEVKKNADDHYYMIVPCKSSDDNLEYEAAMLIVNAAVSEKGLKPSKDYPIIFCRDNVDPILWKQVECEYMRLTGESCYYLVIVAGSSNLFKVEYNGKFCLVVANNKGITCAGGEKDYQTWLTVRDYING